MILLKSLKLTNFCGYKNFEIDLTSNEEVKKWLILFGPNGVGKSNFLNAISLLSSPWRLQSRADNILFLRKLTYHPDYMPNYEGFDQSKTNLYMKATYLTDDGEKDIVLENNWDSDTTGITTNELPEDLYSASFYVDADNPINTQKFQVLSKYREQFLDFANAVYGFKCELPKDRYVEEYNSQEDNYMGFYTDLVITKYHGTRVHFKRMSAGEKKIATMLTELFNNVYSGKSKEGILLIDNLSMHIYYTRHMILIEKLKEFFPNKQFICTTHSPVVISEMEKQSLCDLEKYIN
jgi:AAA15 family ATPase/GTPase